MNMFRNKKDTGNKTQKQYEAFKRRLNASKHAFWFEVLHDSKKWELFILWRKKIRGFEDKPLSLKKFVFDQRKKRKFHVPSALIRDNALNKILNQ
jgi:hypothetical protein